MDSDDRLTALEIALTHQDRVVEELNAVVRDQADRLDMLTAQVLRLSQRLMSVEASLPDGDFEANRPPPHW